MDWFELRRYLKMISDGVVEFCDEVNEDGWRWRGGVTEVGGGGRAYMEE